MKPKKKQPVDKTFREAPKDIKLGPDYLDAQDLELEELIQAASLRASQEKTEESWYALVRLVGQRSPRQIARMEARMGLA
jgi:hypothetical protein